MRSHKVLETLLYVLYSKNGSHFVVKIHRNPTFYNFAAFFVLGVGFEPTTPFGARILSPLRKPFRHPSKITLQFLEASGGIEPPYKSFADSCLATWLRRQKS